MSNESQEWEGTANSSRLRVVELPFPEPFTWNLAYDMMHKAGTEKATVIGLSMISEQLDYIAKRISNG